MADRDGLPHSRGGVRQDPLQQLWHQAAPLLHVACVRQSVADGQLHEAGEEGERQGDCTGHPGQEFPVYDSDFDPAAVLRRRRPAAPHTPQAAARQDPMQAAWPGTPRTARSALICSPLKVRQATGRSPHHVLATPSDSWFRADFARFSCCFDQIGTPARHFLSQDWDRTVQKVRYHGKV